MSIKADLHHYVYHLVLCEGKVSDGFYSLRIDDLDELDQSHLLSLYLQVNDKNLDSLFEGDFKTFVSDFIRFLDNPLPERAAEFAKTAAINTLDYHRKGIQEMINDIADEASWDRIHENKGHYYQDKQNGEYVVC